MLSSLTHKHRNERQQHLAYIINDDNQYNSVQYSIQCKHKAKASIKYWNRKVKSAILETVHLPFISIQPNGGKLKSVIHASVNTDLDLRLVTFPVAKCHCPLSSTKGVNMPMGVTSMPDLNQTRNLLITGVMPKVSCHSKFTGA